MLNISTPNSVYLEQLPELLQAALNHPILEYDAEQSLLKQAKAQNIRAQQRLVEHNLKLVAKICRQFTFGTLEDRFQAGVLGLYDAIEKHRLDGSSFASCAVWWIKNRIRALQPQEDLVQSQLCVDLASTEDSALYQEQKPQCLPYSILYCLQVSTEAYLTDLNHLFDIELAHQLSRFPRELPRSLQSSLSDLCRLWAFGLSYSEIATELGLKKANVTYRFKLLKQSLRKAEQDISESSFWRRFDSIKPFLLFDGLCILTEPPSFLLYQGVELSKLLCHETTHCSQESAPEGKPTSNFIYRVWVALTRLYRSTASIHCDDRSSRGDPLGQPAAILRDSRAGPRWRFSCS